MQSGLVNKIWKTSQIRFAENVTLLNSLWLFYLETDRLVSSSDLLEWCSWSFSRNSCIKLYCYKYKIMKLDLCTTHPILQINEFSLREWMKIVQWKIGRKVNKKSCIYCRAVVIRNLWTAFSLNLACHLPSLISSHYIKPVLINI